MLTFFLQYGLLLPPLLMLAASALAVAPVLSVRSAWNCFILLSGLAVASACAAPWLPIVATPGWLYTDTLGLVCAVLVQVLGTVIAAFSARYLAGEPGQRGYIAALAGVLATVHVLLLADHWLILILSWSVTGFCLRHLLCFYQDRPFARLAAHKKHIADRLADGLLLAAAGLAWHASGTGSLSGLWGHLAREGVDSAMQLSATCLVLAVVLRTALLPVHGWLTQVMEAPTPVSALLHAGVVNLGGFVLIRFAPLLDTTLAARTLLLVFGLATAVLAGLVMLTRVSIKLRLAWSTISQMGFLLLECALGLYTLAALHLLGHSLYKAHAFLSASTVVRQTRLQSLAPQSTPHAASTLLAPLVTVAMLLLLHEFAGAGAWPWWWGVILGLGWAPLLWVSTGAGRRTNCAQAVSGTVMVLCLGALALAVHRLPLGVQDRPDDMLGIVAMIGMTTLYLALVVLQCLPEALQGWRRWSYAGFYIDEIYTRLALRVWPGIWMPPREPKHARPAQPLAMGDAL